MATLRDLAAEAFQTAPAGSRPVAAPGDYWVVLVGEAGPVSAVSPDTTLMDGARPPGVLVRTAEELKTIDGLVIPGGESTTMLKLINFMGLNEPLRRFAGEKPIFGTCAGAILLAKEVCNPEQESFGALDLTVERNAYGRQIDSQVANIQPAVDFQQRAGAGAGSWTFAKGPQPVAREPGRLGQR